MSVSILIPCFNAEKWIHQCIESALSQRGIRFEVVVYDDGSTDNSREVITSFGDRIRFEAGPNRGGNFARNRLLSLANFDWVQYLDADDYLLPDKISSQVRVLDKNPNVDVIYSPITLLDTRSGTQETRVLPINGSEDLWIALALWHLPQTGSPLWRKQAIVDVGDWKMDQPCCQEHELYLRLLMAGKKFVFSPASEAVYRQWSSSTVCTRDKSEVLFRKLEILRKAEEFLTRKFEYTTERQRAFSSARFEAARVAYRASYRALALEAIKELLATDPDFVPSSESFLYRAVFSVFGFATTERLCVLRRLVLRRYT